MATRAPRILPLLLLLLLPAPAFGRAAGAKTAPALQRQATGNTAASNHVELTAFNGYQTPKDLYSTGQAKIGLRDNYVVGGRVAYFLSQKLGIEASYSRNTSDLEARSAPSGFADTTALGGVVVHQMELGVVMSDPAKAGGKSQGFLVLGIGETRFVGDVPVTGGTASDTRFAWHAGIGTKMRIGDPLSLRLEARYRSINTTPRGVLYTDQRGNQFSYDPSWYRSFDLTAGLTYKIGG